MYTAAMASVIPNIKKLKGITNSIPERPSRFSASFSATTRLPAWHGDVAMVTFYTTVPTIQNVFSVWHRTQTCMKWERINQAGARHAS